MLRIYSMLILVSLCTTAHGFQGASDSCALAAKESLSLTPQELKLLDQYGAVKGRRLSNFVILGPKLVPDCEIRMHFELFVTKIMHSTLLRQSTGTHARVPGADNPQEEMELEEEREFAMRHRALFGRVIRQLFPLIAGSPAIPSDGALRDRKWNLLLEPAIGDDDLAKILSTEMSSGGLAEPASILFERPLSSIDPQLKRVLKHPRFVSESLYAIALLSRSSRKDFVPLLTKIEKQKNLTPVQGKVIRILINKLQSGEQVKWRDVEDLNYDEI